MLIHCSRYDYRLQVDHHRLSLYIDALRLRYILVRFQSKVVVTQTLLSRAIIDARFHKLLGVIWNNSSSSDIAVERAVVRVCCLFKVHFNYLERYLTPH